MHWLRKQCNRLSISFTSLCLTKTETRGTLNVQYLCTTKYSPERAVEIWSRCIVKSLLCFIFIISGEGRENSLRVGCRRKWGKVVCWKLHCTCMMSWHCQITLYHNNPGLIWNTRWHLTNHNSIFELYLNVHTQKSKVNMNFLKNTFHVVGRQCLKWCNGWAWLRTFYQYLKVKELAWNEIMLITLNVYF